MKRTILLLFAAFLLCGNSTSTLPFRAGKDFALFFAVNDYDHWDDLANPVSDVEAIAKDLKDLYGFETEIVRNPDRKTILDKIEAYRKKTYVKDAQLLIFFSGHGEFNEDSKQGYFVPKNGQKNDTYGDSYIEYEGLKRRISSLPCEHILLALDACYSGTADESIAMRGEPGKRPGASADAEQERYIAGALQYRSRIMLTSGSKVRTPDKSQFVAKFLEALRARGGQDGLLNSPELLGYLTTALPKPVATQFGDHAPGGEFLFVLEGAPSAAGTKTSDAPKVEDKTAADIAAWKKAGQLNLKSAYREYQKSFCPGGAYCDVAEVRVTKFLENDKKAWDSAKEVYTVKSLQQYLDDYPEGEFRTQAQTALQSEVIFWQQTVEKSTKESFSAYLKAFPSGKYREYAEESIKKIDWAQPVTPADLQHDMIFVKSGTFTMGCTPEQGESCDDSEKPAHQVTVGDFYIGRYEVTQKQWRQVMGSDDWWSSWTCDECPINKVSWNEVQTFIKKLNKMTKLEYRLPTEAEWEYAARGGNQSKGYKYAGSNDLDEVRIWSKGFDAHPVGQRKPNELGIYDMSGNVQEWCADGADIDYKITPYTAAAQTNPTGPKSKETHVRRGGAYYEDDARLRVSARNIAQSSWWYLGFRLARSK